MSVEVGDALFAACKYGRMEDIESLLQISSANWNAQDPLGNTPLHYAASAGHVKIIKELLLSGKVNANIQNLHGDTPLHKAAIKLSDNYVSIADDLVSIGKADINIKNKDGKTAADLARNRDIRVVCEPYVENGSEGDEGCEDGGDESESE